MLRFFIVYAVKCALRAFICRAPSQVLRVQFIQFFYLGLHFRRILVLPSIIMTRRFPVLRTIPRNFGKEYPKIPKFNFSEKMGVALPRPSGRPEVAEKHSQNFH